MCVSANSRMSAEIDRCLSPLLEGYRSYALLDFPDHMNIGDSAIYAGELAILDRQFGVPAALVTTYHHPVEPVAAFSTDTVILLHGGGNFGDIWGPHQLYREAVLDACRDHKVIQLPQSIHFSDETARGRTARAIAAHPDFTLLVRDKPSFALAQNFFDCQTLMCPDMAFGLTPVTPPKVPIRHEILCLMREDHERVADVDPDGFVSLGHVADWPVDMDSLSSLSRVVLRFGEHLPIARMRRREQFYRIRARAQTRRGFRMIAAAERVVTDRLHGHIMSCLLNKPHVVLDNSYGKVSNFIEAWPSDSYTRRATDLKTARAALEEFST